MEDTQATPATAPELFVSSLLDKGLSQALTDIGLSNFVVDWLHKELNVPPLFARLTVKTLARLADKAGKEVGHLILKILMRLPYYKALERKLNALLTYIDTEPRATEDAKRVFAGERSAAISPDMAKTLTLDLQGELKILRDVEALSEMFGEVATQKQLCGIVTIY